METELENPDDPEIALSLQTRGIADALALMIGVILMGSDRKQGVIYILDEYIEMQRKRNEPDDYLAAMQYVRGKVVLWPSA